MLDLILPAAYAQTTAVPAVGPTATLFSFLPLILIVVVFYFFIIRPQSKRFKEHKDMLNALKKGDRVVAAGGLVGEVIHVGDEIVTLEIAQGVRVKASKASVSYKLDKADLK